MKFGGAAVKDAAGFERCARIVGLRPEIRPVVVLSAMSGVTDLLTDILDDAQRDERCVSGFITSIRKKHADVLDTCVSDASFKKSALKDVNNVLSRLERVLYGIAYTEEITPKTRDFVLAVGERLSARTLAAVLRSATCPALALDADGIGLITDGVFGAASPLLNEASANLQQSLMPFIARGEVPVVTGFFGCDAEGRTTVLGRGGSDFSAAIVARALDAREVEVWKDVPGFLSADPTMVPDARNVPEMGYEEAAELSYFGARILHPRTVEPVMDKQIGIRVKGFQDPEAPGTLVFGLGGDGPGEVHSIASRGGLSMVTLYGPGMAYTPGLAGELFGALSEETVNVYSIGTSMASLSVIVEGADAANALKAIKTLHESVVHDITVVNGVSLVCVAGSGMRRNAKVVGRVFRAVAKTGADILLNVDGGSKVTLNFAVPDADCGKVVEAVHAEFMRT
ncbi:aspartate kinase [Planctomycetota bacterium]